MRIFVTGPSGYIGSAVAAALARAGHEVHGLVRTAEKAQAAERAEILPVMGTLLDTGSWKEAAGECQVLIHCAADYAAMWEADRNTVETFLQSARAAGAPRLIIYTSGVWVYGDTGAAMKDEASALNPAAFSLPRVEHERIVLEGSGGRVRTMVLRPGCVYGGRGGLTASWFANQGIVGDGDNRWAMVHVEDLADAYVRVAESGLDREVFNLTDRSRFTVRECAEAALCAAGVSGPVLTIPLEQALEKMGPWATALAFDQNIDSSLAARRLGWQPRHGGFVDGVKRYYAAWKARQG